MKSTMTETCSAVLRSRRNCSSDGAERTDDGRAFHARAAVTNSGVLSSVALSVSDLVPEKHASNVEEKPTDDELFRVPRPPVPRDNHIGRSPMSQSTR